MSDNVTRQVPTANGTITVRVGDILEGVEGNVTTRIQIVYLSKDTLLAKHLWSRRDNGAAVCPENNGKESSWTLMCRDWKHVQETPKEEEQKDVVVNYTDEEVDKVALAIANADRAIHGGGLVRVLDDFMDADGYRRHARAALAARDALFEVTGERWEVRWPVRRDKPSGAHAVSRCTTSENAHAEANEMRNGAYIGVHVVHVTTKRRKR